MFERLLCGVCLRKCYVESGFWNVEGSNGGKRSRWILKSERYREGRVVDGN